MNRLIASQLPLAGLMLVSRKRLEDERGYFSRLFCAEILNEAGWHKPVSQINITHTSIRGSIRGLHYQVPPFSEMKLVSCIRGEVMDVAVDLRAGSPTFLQWHAQTLSADNGNAMLIPEGFAHGFQTITDNVEMLYFHSTHYNPSAEAGLRFDDPFINIEWPLQVTQISVRDQKYELLTSSFKGINS
jgi:dTDP-4-dehydrorhamnose 3,5-epimerase